MAYTLSTPQAIPSTGVALTALTFDAIDTGSGNGRSFSADPSLIFIVLNTSGGSLNLTTKTDFVKDGVTLGDQTDAVAAGAYLLLGRLDPEVYQHSDGYYHFEASGSGLEIAAIY